jgi:predicted AAA+ superfamily ATPase
VTTALSDTPVVVIQGARQVGKSTLAESVAAEHDATVVNLDDNNTRRLAEEDPVAFVDRSPGRLMVIDEAQRVPGLILPLKANVDRDRRAGRFLLTGSADLLQVKGVADSLAGRAETVELAPLSQGELARRAGPEDFVAWIGAGGGQEAFDPVDPAVIVRGGFPETTIRTEVRVRAWFSSYTERLAGHDARELNHGGYAADLSSLLRLIAAQGQSELVKAKVARSLGIAESTADTYLRLARAMRLTVEFPAWNRSPRGRLVHRPKVCLTDTGLSAALANFTAPMAINPGGREYYGALVEQFVALELAKQRAWTQMPFDLYHFRDRDGLEVDLLAETFDGNLIAIEVKSTRTITPKLWSGLAAFRERFPDRQVTGVLVHAGTDAATLHGWLHILPVTAIWHH